VDAVGVADAPRQIDGVGDSDPLPHRQSRRLNAGRPRQQLDRAVLQRGAVQVQPDAERLGELARPRAEVLRALEAAPRAYAVEPLERLQRPDQHRGAHALVLRDRIQQGVHSVRAVDVGGAGAAEQHARPVREPRVGVAGGLALVVGLRLDYAAERVAVSNQAAH